MPSDTDSTISSSSSEYKRKHKIKKKSKKTKKSKKEKRKKDVKVKRRDSREDCVTKSVIQLKVANTPICQIKNENSDVPSFGPALPPHLLNKNSSEQSALTIGPTLPKDFDKYANLTNNDGISVPVLESPYKSEEEVNILDSYGPLPVSNQNEMSAVQIELEQRALQLKMAAIDGSTGNSADQKVREEWMLELPEVGLKGGLAALNNLKRGFYQGKDRPDFSDRTSWTKTPQTGSEPQQKPGTSKTSKETLQSQAHALYEKRRDAEQEALAKKHKKKHKRDESLVDIHQKRLRKEEKKKAKELKALGIKPERRPFSRDIDLKLNKIDSNQTKQIVDKAKILDSKFSRGHAKYL